MVSMRPHTLTFTSAATGGGQDPETGYSLPIIPGTQVLVPCRFHLESTKEFKNEDNEVTRQTGRIRVDVGSEMPLLGQIVEVPGHFKGAVKEIYKGQLSWRIDV